jgi:hypothetical protein
MAKFMVILHQSPDGFRDVSPEEAQRIIETYRSWFDKIRAGGRFVGSDKLADEGGKVLSLRQGRVSVTDGPYSETKEVVGGYFVLRAENYEEAIELIRDCPHLRLGRGRLEVRQTDPMGCGEA